MYLFELELLVREKLGRDVGNLLMSFLKEFKAFIIFSSNIYNTYFWISFWVNN